MIKTRMWPRFSYGRQIPIYYCDNTRRNGTTPNDSRNAKVVVITYVPSNLTRAITFEMINPKCS